MMPDDPDRHKKRNDLTDKTYGTWRVLARAVREDKRNRYWFCVCECGTFRALGTAYLRRMQDRPQTATCGACHSARGYPARRIPETDPRFLQTRFNFYKQRAKLKLKVSFELTPEQFYALSTQDCYYCGQAPTMPARMGRAREGQLLVNGVDRVNNDDGYALGNVVACCTTCNEMKLDRGVAEFLTHVQRIAAKTSSRT